MKKFLIYARRLSKLILSLVLLGCASYAFAQKVPVRFQLDWRFEGPAAMFLTPEAKGYFKQEGLNVFIDAGSGSGNAVSRVASGSYDMGFADVATLMEFIGNNPDAPKPVAVMMVYGNTPAAAIALKSSGIKVPADLAGKKIGAPVYDAGRKSWPLFSTANKIGDVSWVAMDAPLRETMLVRGDVDAISGFSFTSMLNLEARGVKPADVVMFRYRDHGVRFYGSAIIASEKFLRERPDAVKAFLRAFGRGMHGVISQPAEAIGYLKVRDGLINEALEVRRLKMMLNDVVLTPDARAEGFGQATGPRLALMASQVSDVFRTKTRVDPNVVWNGSFLPSRTGLDIFHER